MKNLKVSSKLVLSFTIVIAFSIIIGVVGIVGMVSLNNSKTHLYESNLLAIEAMGDLRELFANERNALRTIVLHQNEPERVRSLVADFAENERRAEELFATYEKTIENPALETDFFTARDTWRSDYNQLKRDVIALINEGRFDEAYQTYITRGAPIIDPIASGLDNSSRLNNQWATESSDSAHSLYITLTIVMISALVIAVVVSVFLAFYISGIISKPLLILSAFMEKAGTSGDISLTSADQSTIAKMANAKDEIGQTIGHSATFVSHVIYIAEQLETIAQGDLTIDVKTLSDVDTMGKSLSQMVSNLNNMFGSIQLSTGQVSEGAKQVADGAQSLAQGATEQAASIEELSASIGEIASKTKENADIATKTSKLSDSIKDNALKGSRQMNEMISAVKDINDASQSISKIIKTIDDIAFQTNILALNAAVEAARAGQHGKGFAVVAEEVRNLASKSAEAAKDTGDMIQNSMEKAEFGTQIAGETAASLKEIVDGISDTSQMISGIATASEEQSLGISQINTGIDQVAQVVQQNSATAEQSAAASEEMSSQSTILEELISQFKLKESSTAYNALPSSPKGHYIPAVEHADSGVSGLNDGDFGKY